MQNMLNILRKDLVRSGECFLDENPAIGGHGVDLMCYFLMPLNYFH